MVAENESHGDGEGSDEHRADGRVSEHGVSVVKTEGTKRAESEAPTKAGPPKENAGNAGEAGTAAPEADLSAACEHVVGDEASQSTGNSGDAAVVPTDGQGKGSSLDEAEDRPSSASGSVQAKKSPDTPAPGLSAEGAVSAPATTAATPKSGTTTTLTVAAASPTGDAVAAVPHAPSPADTAGKTGKCCSCTCHESHSAARLPPTSPRRSSRKQQQRRASAPEKPAPSATTRDGGGVLGKGGADASGGGVSSGTASVPGGRAPSTRALVRNLSEESRRPPILGQHQPTMYNSAGVPRTSASSAPSGGDGGASPERKSDYNAGTPPRSERAQPRSGGSAGRRRGGRGSGGGGGGSSSSSVPTPRLSSVRRRKSESGLGLMATVAANNNNRYSDGYPGSAGGRLRSERASSASNALNVTAGVQAAAAAGSSKGGTPPAWTWNKSFNNSGTAGADSRADTGGGAWLRGRSDSDTGDVPEKARGGANGPSTAERAGWNHEGIPRGVGGGDAQGRPGHFSWAPGRGGGGGGSGSGGQEEASSIFRARGGSWDSDPRDGFEFRMDRDLGNKTGARASARSGSKRVSTRRTFPGGARSMSEAAARRLADPVRQTGSSKGRAGWSSDDDVGDASLGGEEDHGDLVLRVYPGEDSNSAGLSRSLGKGFEGSFVGDGGHCGIGEGDTSSLNTPRSGVDLHHAVERGSHDGGGGSGGGRYQDFGGARFQQVVRDRIAAGGSASASQHGGGVGAAAGGGARRNIPVSVGGGGGDAFGYGYGYGGCSEESDRGVAGEGESRQ
ncbi:unnamed protein product, partial [Scytosiphon promiscuus]